MAEKKTPYVVNDRNFYTVFGWMMNVLKLKGNELIIYAIIFSFSQDGVSEFKGQLKFLEDFTNLTKKTVLTNLSSLQEKGYIFAAEYRDENNQRHVAYKANVEILDELQVLKIKGKNV